MVVGFVVCWFCIWFCGMFTAVAGTDIELNDVCSAEVFGNSI